MGIKNIYICDYCKKEDLSCEKINNDPIKFSVKKELHAQIDLGDILVCGDCRLQTEIAAEDAIEFVLYGTKNKEPTSC